MGENEKMKIERGRHNRIIANTFRGISAIRYTRDNLIYNNYSDNRDNAYDDGVNIWNSLTSISRYVCSTGLFEKCAHFEGFGWWPTTGSESFTMPESGRGYRVMAEDDCMWRHEKNTIEIAFAELKAQELSKSFWAGIQRMSAEVGRYKSTGTIRR